MTVTVCAPPPSLTSGVALRVMVSLSVSHRPVLLTRGVRVTPPTPVMWVAPRPDTVMRSPASRWASSTGVRVKVPVALLLPLGMVMSKSFTVW